MISILKTTAAHPGFIQLVALLDNELAARDGAEHSFYAAFNTSATIQHAVIVMDDLLPLACGAFKPYDSITVEIKRMYVMEKERKRGLAAMVLKELETWAASLQYTHCILETGLRQPEAIALYKKCGYTIIPNYGQYQGIENSVCMKKSLTAN